MVDPLGLPGQPVHAEPVHGGPTIWISDKDAAKVGIDDNDWVEAVNRNGVVVARAIISHRMPEGTVVMHHAQERSNLTGHPHDYRETVCPWFRSVLFLRPDTDLIKAAPFGFQLHVELAWLLFAFWPFTRLVHVFSAPLGYLTRPYVPYRSQDLEARAGMRAPRRGWEKVGSGDRP